MSSKALHYVKLPSTAASQSSSHHWAEHNPVLKWMHLIIGIKAYTPTTKCIHTHNADSLAKSALYVYACPR